MRTTLFLSTLFAVSLVGGAALAENPHSAPTRVPRAIERVRAHGDTVDKSYRGADKVQGQSTAEQQASQVVTQAQQARQRFDRSASRINCSESGAECGSARKDGSTQAFDAAGSKADRNVRAPAFMDKFLGSDRTNFNEAGEDQGMSSRAAKRAWSKAAAANHAATGNTDAPAADGEVKQAAPNASPTQLDSAVRTQRQSSEERMSCNEAGECSMSNKAVAKIWAYDAIQKGTWTGPKEAPKPTAAELAIKQMKKEQDAKKQ
ncbi:MAG: hypothetical protein QM820_65570 [Minicystis sp.]